ncbi:hypothetical protein LWI29_003455 [Acer saccharum]|uniref:Uncharacterized protein n=1 Tax=Acer saccharum TaxID=4024 RepID=A0AA39W256_ACESA|nr:hypothetical protein LWI29_003455 [Acer saccharum]
MEESGGGRNQFNGKTMQITPFNLVNGKTMQITGGLSPPHYRQNVMMKEKRNTKNTLKMWWNDLETKRRKRVAKYKFYSVEGKVKSSLKKGFRWMKKKCSRIIHDLSKICFFFLFFVLRRRRRHIDHPLQRCSGSSCPPSRRHSYTARRQEMVTMEFKDGDVEIRLSKHQTIKREDGIEEVKVSEDCTMILEDGAKTEPKKTRKRRLSIMMDEEDDIQIPEKRYKNVILSLMKPSYLLRLGRGSKNIRFENRKRLRYLLRKLVRQHNWADASGVLSVLLKGTSKEKSPIMNRIKFTVSMELLKQVESERINPIRIKNVYDIWMKRIGSVGDSPLEERYTVHLEFILFCLTQGDFEEAHQAAMSLMQEREFGSHPMSNMVMALTFCQRWFSGIPREMQKKDSDRTYSPRVSEISGERLNLQVKNSEAHDTVYSNEADTHLTNDSETSVMIGKRISAANDSNLHREGPVEGDVDLQRERFKKHLPQCFNSYSTENEASFSNDGGPGNNASIFFALERLDSWLLPIKLPNSNEDYENYIRKHMKLLNDDYKNAIKYLRFALLSTPPVPAALLPLIQLLLIGGHVDEAMNELEKFCSDSSTALPIRLKATLLECFDRNNYVMISTCFEDILKKDPTCSHSLARLISMHQNGDYSPTSLLEMIALHLDATYANENTWREFALCFLKLSRYDEDRMSVCLDGNESEQKQFSHRYNRPPTILTEGKLGQSWKFRCKWWLNRHFSKNMLASEIAAGDIQLLTYKAACACHMYGQESDYFVKACSYLEKVNNKDLFMTLKMHKYSSMKLYLFILSTKK